MKYTDESAHASTLEMRPPLKLLTVEEAKALNAKNAEQDEQGETCEQGVVGAESNDEKDE